MPVTVPPRTHRSGPLPVGLGWDSEAECSASKGLVVPGGSLFIPGTHVKAGFTAKRIPPISRQNSEIRGNCQHLPTTQDNERPRILDPQIQESP